MSVTRTLATFARVLRQTGRDRRSVAMVLLLPPALLALLRYVYDDGVETFQRVGPALLGIFPFVTMFLITSVAMLRERTSGTLERLMTTPIGRGDLLAGYGLAFGTLATIQAGLTSLVGLGWLDVDVQGPLWVLVLLTLLDALLGTGLGLAVSALARSEFQAVQFLPAVVLPQFLLCGLLVPREEMVGWLHAASNALPLSYAVDGMRTLSTTGGVGTGLVTDLAVVAGCVVGSVALAAATLRRRSG